VPTEYESYLNITLDRDGSHATITLARPEKMNPLNAETIAEIRDVVTRLDRDAAIRTVALTGSGRAFSAGGDLEKYLTLFREQGSFRNFMEDWYAIIEGIEASDKVFIAAINGVCVAGGLELLLACDIVIAAEDARIGDGHLNFGQLPGAGSSVRLWRAVGHQMAKHLMLTGDLLSAQDARTIGLVGTVVPGEDLQETVRAVAGRIAAKTPVGVSYAKKLLNNAISLDYVNALRQEIVLVEKYATTEPDAIEGLKAFKEKRQPRFGGL
jgi:enoyl-CoA hydratase